MEHLPDYSPWPRQSLYDLMESLLPAADGDLVLFAETEDGQVVGWLPGIPRLNEALIHAGGLRYPRDDLPQLAGHLGAVIYKRYRVYRKWLGGVPLDQPGPAGAPAAHPQ